MARKQSVVLKGKKDGIDVVLDDKAEFEKICSDLKERIADAKNFFADAKAAIAFKGRALTDKQESMLLDIILSETTMDVSFVECEEAPPDTQTHANAYAQAQAGANRHGGQSAQEALSTKGLSFIEQATVFHRGALRSGQAIKHDGSVVVVGDTNAGSEIIAGGNVVVLGSLKGMVHAGAYGDGGCFVAALHLIPTQLRIANIITCIPAPSGRDRESKKNRMPSYAYVQDGLVYIAPLWD